MSCASCHKPALAFADSVAFSGAHIAEFKRNTPSLFNVAWYPYFFSEGGVPSLELVSVAPIQSRDEMDFNLGEAIKRLQADDSYLRLFDEAYDTLPSTYTLVRALGAFQRTLISAGSPYDKFLQGDSLALGPQEKRGMALFFSDSLACHSCHKGFLFTDFGFYALGFSAQDDPGRFRLTTIASDSGKFKTPSLRNLAFTAPYMHDGSIPDLLSVIRFYEAGAEKKGPKSERLKPFRLQANDENALLAFLLSLSDSTVLHQPDFLPLER